MKYEEEYLNILKSVKGNEMYADKTINDISELVMSEEAYYAGLKSIKNKAYGPVCGSPPARGRGLK